MVWTQEWFDRALSAVKKKCATQPEERQEPFMADSVAESSEVEAGDQPWEIFC